MNRTRLNFVIDAVAFGAFLCLASTGVMLRYQLPPGSGGLAGRGTGWGEAQRSVSTVWSWTRHDWGAIHFWIACAMLAVLAVHLLLHGKWIVCVVRGKRTDRSGWRFGLGAIGLAALVLLAAAPWLSPTVNHTRAELRRELGVSSPADGRTSRSDDLLGSMTLEQIADGAGVSVNYLVEQLDLPDGVSPAARVGPLLRAQGLRMSDLRRVVDQAVGPSGEAEQDREAVR
jgi:Domain of unknown function (DUF4405)